MKRKIIQITSSGGIATFDGDEPASHVATDNLYALCNTGEIFYMDLTHPRKMRRWEKLPDIPQDEDKAR